MSETATIDPRVEKASEMPVGTGDDETTTPETPDTGEGGGQEGGEGGGDGESSPSEPEAPASPPPAEAG